MTNLRKNIWFWTIILIILIIVLLILFRDKDTYSKKVAKNIVKYNTLKFAVSGEPLTLDPNLINAVWGARIVANLFEGLTVRMSDSSIGPGVAKKWEVSKDGKNYIFYLRKDAKWSDNTPVTAEDFVFSIKRVLNPDTKSYNANLLYIIKGAKDFHTGEAKESAVAVYAIDKYILKITLIAPAPYFPELVSHTSFLPIPKHVVLKNGKKWYEENTIISNGPYKIIKWKSKKYIDAVKNPYYWDKNNVHIDKVKFYISDNKQLLLKEYLANNIDILTDLSVEIYNWASKNLPEHLKIFPFMSTYYYLVNSKNSKFRNPKVRLALNMSIDRKFITQNILMLPDTPISYTLIPSNFLNYVSSLPYWVNWSMERRIKESKNLLKGAGFDENHPLTFSLSYNNSETNKLVAQAMAAMWKNIGVNTYLLAKPPTQHYYDIVFGNYDLAQNLWIADYTDPSTFIFIFNDVTHHYLDFDHCAYNKECLYIIYSKNISETMKHYKNAENILLNSNTIIPLYNSMAKVLIKPWIKGFEVNSMDVHLIKYMSISE